MIFASLKRLRQLSEAEIIHLDEAEKKRGRACRQTALVSPGLATNALLRSKKGQLGAVG